MKTTKALFSELMYDFQSERWNEFELSKLSLRELLALVKLLGCPAEKRSLFAFSHNVNCARFTDNPKELAISIKANRSR